MENRKRLIENGLTLSVKMEVFNLLLLILFSIILGIVLTVVIQYYVLLKYVNKGPVANIPKKMEQEAFSLPETLKKKLDLNESIGSSLPISLMLQFLFHELRHSNSIKQWLYKKLTLEFDELLTKTTIGKFFDAVHIRDMHLGSQFPDIHEISLDSLDLDESEGYINTLNLSINLDYTGNFLLAVDAKMKFGKTAYLSIKVKRINGVARLQFTRVPYSHWSFSFYTEPMIELAVESHFQGRQLQSNITNLIVNQIKKAIKRKHSLPNYKLRYKPFFVKTDPGQVDQNDDIDLLPQGQLEVVCGDVSRLATTADISAIYCTFTIDTVPFICVHQRDNIYYVTMEITLTKVHQQQLGVIFRQENSVTVTVDCVTPQTPAYNSGLKAGDTVVSIENKAVSNVSQIGKIVKSVPTNTLSFKIERLANNYIIRPAYEEKSQKAISTDEDGGLNESETLVIAEKLDESDRKICGTPKLRLDKLSPNTSSDNISKFAHTLGSFSLRKRKSSVEKPNDSSNKSTPNPSCPNTPQHSKGNIVCVSSNFTAIKKNSISEVPEIIRTDTENQEIELLNMVVVYKGKTLPLKSLMHFNEDFIFNLKESVRYLNVNVWGIAEDKEDVLLGYTNVPLGAILDACLNSKLGQYTKSYSFLPPNNIPTSMVNHPLISHSGFESVFCYGDILLSFGWNNEENLELKRRNSVVASEAKNKPLKLSGSQHDFVRTQFHRSIHCDFCSKKIWLKDAVQCRSCGMCCHKKCVAKCQLSSECLTDKTEKCETTDLSPNDLIDSVADEQSMKRVNSVNNLSIPGAHIPTSQSRSLPPSPQRTPARKHSIHSLCDPFSLCPAALEEIQNASPEVSHEAINKILDQILLSATEENLMENARESGRRIYASMGPEEKLDKINTMVGELKAMFDYISNEHTELSNKMAAETNDVEKAKYAFLLGQADAKIQGLSVLMLHFCSGLQQL